MARIEMYTKTFCPFCIRVQHLLDSKGVPYELHVIGFDGPKRDEMIERAKGRTTVPQIFIDGQHVGGCDELMRLEREGRLDALLAA